MKNLDFQNLANLIVVTFSKAILIRIHLVHLIMDMVLNLTKTIKSILVMFTVEL